MRRLFGELLVGTSRTLVEGRIRNHISIGGLFQDSLLSHSSQVSLRLLLNDSDAKHPDIFGSACFDLNSLCTLVIVSFSALTLLKFFDMLNLPGLELSRRLAFPGILPPLCSETLSTLGRC